MGFMRFQRLQIGQPKYVRPSQSVSYCCRWWHVFFLMVIGRSRFDRDGLKTTEVAREFPSPPVQAGVRYSSSQAIPNSPSHPGQRMSTGSAMMGARARQMGQTA